MLTSVLRFITKQNSLAYTRRPCPRNRGAVAGQPGGFSSVAYDELYGNAGGKPRSPSGSPGAGRRHRARRAASR